MPIFEVWDVVKVPFPYGPLPYPSPRAGEGKGGGVRQRRPALVLAAGDLQIKHGLLWLAMITSATHRGWYGDVLISDQGVAGLPAPSIVRPAKIATIDAQDAGKLGILPTSDREAVRRHLRERLRDIG